MQTYERSEELWRKVREIFDLPRNTTSATITMRPGHLVTIECEVIPETGSDAFVKVLREYKLTPIEQKPSKIEWPSMAGG